MTQTQAKRIPFEDSINQIVAELFYYLHDKTPEDCYINVFNQTCLIYSIFPSTYNLLFDNSKEYYEFIVKEINQKVRLAPVPSTFKVGLILVGDA